MNKHVFTLITVLSGKTCINFLQYDYFEQCVKMEVNGKRSGWKSCKNPKVMFKNRHGCKQIVESQILDLDRGESGCLDQHGVSLELRCLIDRLHTRLTRASDLASFTSPCRSPPPFLSLLPLPERLETRGGGHVQGEMPSGGDPLSEQGGGQRLTKAIQVKTSSELAWASQAPCADNTGANVLAFAEPGPPFSAVCVCLWERVKSESTGKWINTMLLKLYGTFLKGLC